MEKYLLTNSTLPKKFIKDFFAIAKEQHLDNEYVIDFDKVVLWLDVIKGNLVAVLKREFDDGDGYITTTKIKKRSTGATTYNEILLTPDCFKMLCMISSSNNAKLVRHYFLEMEKIVKKYYKEQNTTKDKEIEQLKINQRPKLPGIRQGIIYIIKALNTDRDVYKVGRTLNQKKRFSTYNTLAANELEPLFTIPVDDVVATEKCILGSCIKFNYRKHKETYEIDLTLLKDICKFCADISNYIKKFEDNNSSYAYDKIIDDLRDPSTNCFAYVDPI